MDTFRINKLSVEYIKKKKEFENIININGIKNINYTYMHLIDNNDNLKEHIQIVRKDLTKSLEELELTLFNIKNDIKKEIDRLYKIEQYNFIEIETQLRKQNIPLYLIAEQNDDIIKGTITINLDNEPVSYITKLLITDDINDLWEYFNLTDQSNELKYKMLDNNLNLLIKAGTVVINDELELKNFLINLIYKDRKLSQINDY